MFLQCFEYSCGPLNRSLLRGNWNQRSRRVHSLTQDIECADGANLIRQVHVQLLRSLLGSRCVLLFLTEERPRIKRMNTDQNRSEKYPCNPWLIICLTKKLTEEFDLLKVECA